MAAYAGPTPYAFNDTYARRAGFNEVRWLQSTIDGLPVATVLYYIKECVDISLTSTLSFSFFFLVRWMQVAEANNIVILYPQLHYGDRATCASEADDCWDQGGSTGDTYSDVAGPQVQAVKAMIQKILQ